MVRGEAGHELGGVLIKLGQFLSTRVDLLPPEITGELAGLQDEVPAVEVARIVPVVEEELGGPLDELFASFSVAPAGSASLAQVHFAVLTDGTEVAVKVLRPGIGILVETDLAALEVATRWLKLWPAARRRVDVDWLMREFRAITRHELDLEAEGRASERFAADFADDPVVVVPRVWWSHTARSVLTLERITGIKLSRTGAIRESGVDPGRVGCLGEAGKLQVGSARARFREGGDPCVEPPVNLGQDDMHGEIGRREAPVGPGRTLIRPGV